MILKARRAVRRRISGGWTRKAWPVVGVGSLAVVAAGMLTSYVSVEAGVVGLVGFVALALVEGFAYVDRCVECDERVDVKNDHYCSACGESLSAIPYRPADLEDVDDGRAAA